MHNAKCKSFGLSSNMLKIIAAISMFVDHMGIMLFPRVAFLHIVGRLAFPIFAFMIAEGCAYTKNKLKYFLSVFLLGIACQAVYAFSGGTNYFGILLTFSLSIIMIYALQNMKDKLFSQSSKLPAKILSAGLLIICVVIVFWLNEKAYFDYGFLGCMVPVFASIPRRPKNGGENWDNIDSRETRLLTFSFGLIILCGILGEVQMHSLLALPLLLLYSGKRGTLNLKYFFYVFYPAHLVFLFLISVILKFLN